MKFLILSDLHACNKSAENEYSRLVFDGEGSEFGVRFIEYCKSLKISPDFLVCAGDISNQGCTDSFQKGWEFLHKVRDELNIKELICVPGNHDVQSRNSTGISPLHKAKFCSPPFPSSEFQFNTHFWGWGWGYLEYEEFNCILLNSSAYHGYNQEFRHGRVAQETVKQISDFISSKDFNSKHFNMLLCHHHPVKREDIDLDSDIEVMDGGQLLISTLESITRKPWLVIHGHKHFASLFSAQSAGYNPPLIFSAGSFSAKLYPKISNRTSNQFYILNVDLQKTIDNEKLIGTFETHSWDVMNNWHPSKSKNLPHRGGFGSDIRPVDIVKNLNNMLKDTTYLNCEELYEINEIIKNVTPTQYSELVDRLQIDFELEISDNLLIEVSKK